MSSHDEKPIISKYTKRFQNPNGNLNVPFGEENEEDEFLSQLLDDNNSSVVAGSMTASSIAGTNRFNLDVPKDSILNEYPYMKIQRENMAASQLSFNSRANTSESSVIYSITSSERDSNKKALNSKENRPIFDHSSPISNPHKNEPQFREPTKTLKTDFNKAKASPVNNFNVPTLTATPTLIPPTRASTPTKQQPTAQTATTTIPNENHLLKNALNRRPVKLGILPSNNKKQIESNTTDLEASTVSILPSYKSNSNNSFAKRKVRIQSPKTSERFNSRPTTPSSSSSTTIITMPKIQKPLQAVPSSLARPIIVENIRLNQPQTAAQPILSNKFYRPMYSNLLNPPVIYQEMPVLVETVQPVYMTTAPSYSDLASSTASSTTTLINGSTNNMNLLKSRIQLEKYPLTYAEQKTQQSNPSPYIYKARPFQSNSQHVFLNKTLNGGPLAPGVMRNPYDQPVGLSVQKNPDYMSSMQPKPLKSILKNSTTKRNNSANLYAQNKNTVRINV